MSNIKLYIINYTVPQYNKIGIASVTAISAQKAQSILQATGKYNAYKYNMSYPVLVHTTDTFTAESIITELDNPAGEKGDRGPQGPKGEKGDPGEELTLTTKPNGNIVIGNLAGQSKEFMPATPSGDPMHYIYEAVGATWDEGAGYWKMYTLTDVTNEQMRAAVARGAITCGEKQPLSNSYRSLNGIRFNLARTGNYTMYLDIASAEYYAYANETIEVINLTFYKNLGSQYDGSGLQMTSLNHSFCLCSKLRQILGKILLSGSSINTTNAFKGCASLEDLRLAGLGGNISFADSPHLSKESLLYMINNCASGVSFTITLHPDVYAKCTSPDAMSGEWENDVYNAIEDMLNEKDSSITLASA